MYKTKPCIRLYGFALIYTGTFNVPEIFWKDGLYNPHYGMAESLLQHPVTYHQDSHCPQPQRQSSMRFAGSDVNIFTPNDPFQRGPGRICR